MRYHLWTIGCQMNVADSRRLAAALETLGYTRAARAEEADVVVLNTCVVRQSAEDKVYGRLSSLRPLKERRPNAVVAVMGCLVGGGDYGELARRIPFVDVFMPPSAPEPLLEFLQVRALTGAGCAPPAAAPPLPAHERGLATAYVPLVYGCSHGCSYCIIPYRRGPERSRPAAEALAEARALVAQGVREITFLGQIVDRYGLDLPAGPSLAALLRQASAIEGVERLRFLTSHPNWFSDELLAAIVELPPLCEHIELPVQSGDDEVLARMKRGYTVAAYRRLIEKIRRRAPGVAIHTDVIVGFPGESEAQFMNTYRLLEELRFDKVHIARYSPRPQTLAQRRLKDDVPAAEKERRRRALDELQQRIAGEIDAARVGQTAEAIVEEQRRGKWMGRTRTNKIVFFAAAGDWRRRLAQVKITWAGPWSMQGVAFT